MAGSRGEGLLYWSGGERVCYNGQDGERVYYNGRDGERVSYISW